MRAVRLQTEYLENPVGLGITRPRLMWNAEGGVKQTACRITAEKWDSGVVETDSMRAEYPQALCSRERVHWTVTLRDENGVWGEPAQAYFEMGLTQPSDWRAQWIAGDYAANRKKRYPVDCFKREFSPDAPVVRARLYAAARGVYDVTINGQRPEDFILAPGTTDYRKRIQYQTYDVTDLIRQTNTLELRLADGWYRGSLAAYGFTGVYGTQTSVIAQLELYAADGSVQTIVTDGSWAWSNDGPLRFADLKDGEIYDAALSPSYAGRAIVVKPPKAVLCASDNVAVREQERLSATLLPHNVLDFGQNIAGYLSFRVKGRKGQQIRLIAGETLDENGNVALQCIQERKPVRGWTTTSLIKKLMTGQTPGETVPTPLQEIHFTCSGGEDFYKTSFAVFGFRYVQIFTDLAVTPQDYTAIAVYSDMERTGSFACADERVNRLFENTVWSMKSNFLDVPTDCPTRERLGWTGDAQIFFGTGAYIMNTAPFFRKWLRDMADSQYKNGTIPAVFPFSGGEMVYKNTGVSAGWADAVYLIPYRYWKTYGDADLLRSCLPMMRAYADYLLSHLGQKDRRAAKENPYNEYTYEKGMHLGEWLEPEQFQESISAGHRPAHTEEATAYLHLAMKTMAEIEETLGDRARAALYSRYAEGSKKAYARFAQIDTDRQAKLVRPLALGLLDAEEKAAAQARLVQSAENNGYHVGTGFLSTPFLLPVLCDAGHADTAYRTLLNTEKPGWLYEVGAGATTTWETWEGNLSRNHYSPGAVCQWLFEYCAGIRTAGENLFALAPQPGGNLGFAQASYRSVYGEVVSRWEQTAHGTKYTFTVPANTSAEICLPDGRRQTVGAGVYEYFTESC